jgi:WD40 repeat protein/uncharacterized caspase-like protein
MRLLSTMTLCLLCPVLVLAGEEAHRPLAVLDSSGHTAPIGQLLFAPDGQTLYSVSVDRTLRVWDVRSGRTREVLRPPIFGESFGQLSRAALSPDGRLLAVAGNTTQNGTSFETYLIALHPQARMQHVLKEHSAAITAVCFSPNGDQLATGSLDKTVRVWTAASGEGRVLETGKEPITGLAFSPDGKALAVATPAGGRILSVDKSQPDVSLRQAGELLDIAWSSEGKTIAAARAVPPTLALWNTDGSSRKRIDLPGVPLGCRFIAANRVLTALRVPEKDASLSRYGAVLLNLESGMEKPPILGSVVERRFLGVEIEAGCAAYDAKTDLLVLAGGNDPAITLWKRSEGSRLRTLAGTGSAVWSVGWGYTGQSVAWGDEGKFEDFRRNGTRPLHYTFSFSDLKLQPILDEQYQYARQAPDNPPVEGSVYSGLFYKRSSRILAELFAARCGVSLPGDHAAIASLIKMDGRDPFAAHRFAIHDWKGRSEKHRLEGHQGIVNALALSRDNRYLLSGSEDQTLRIWKLGDEPRLLLSLFRGGDDWVTWTPEGCYTASASGARLLGWHVNQRDQLSRFYPAADFQRSLDLPGIFQQMLPRGGVQEALAAAKAAGKDITLLPIEKMLPSQVDRSPANETVHNSGSTVPAAPRNDTLTKKPRLHVLTLAISSAVPTPPPGHTPADNTDAVEKALRDRSKPLFEVQCRRLPDAKRRANREAIRKEIDELVRQVEPGDVAIVLYCGAGERTADGRFYLVPQDADAKNLAATGVDMHDIRELLRKTRGFVLLLLDCHPLRDNRFATDSGRSLAVPDDTVRQAIDSGVAVLRSSLGEVAGPDKDPPPPGLFAETVAEALAGKADQNHDELIDLDELGEYVSTRVRERSSGRQRPKLDCPPRAATLVLASLTDNPRLPRGEKYEPEDNVVVELPPPVPVAQERAKMQKPDPEDAVLDLQLPAGSSVTINGMERGSNTHFVFGPLRRGSLQQVELRIRAVGDKEHLHRILMCAGWKVHLTAATGADRPEMVVQTGHTQEIRAAAISGNGKWLLSGGKDRVAILWDIATGRQMRVFHGHTKTVQAVAFSSDGSHILTGSEDATAILWETETGKLVRTYKGHGDTVFAVGFHPDGKHIVTGSGDHTAIVWLADSDKKIVTLQGHKGAVHGVAFSPDGRQIVTGSADGAAILWEAASGQPVHRFDGPRKPIRAVAFSANGRRMAAGAADGTAIVWDASSWQELLTWKGHEQQINALTFNSDGSQILTGSADGRATLWAADSGKSIRILKGHTGGVTAVAFHPKDKRVLTGSTDQTVFLWDVDRADAAPQAFRGTVGGVTTLAIDCRRGQYVISGSVDRMARLWDLASGRPVKVLSQHKDRVGAVALGPECRSQLTGCDDGAVRLWQLADPQPLASGEVIQKSPIHAVAFSPDGTRAVAGCGNGHARLYDVASRSCLRTWEAHADGVHAVVFASDGKTFLTASNDQTAILWDAATGAKIRAFEGHQGEVRAAAISQDGKRIMTGHDSGTAILWATDSGKQILGFPHQPDRVNAVAISSDGRLLLTTSAATAILWDAAGRRLRDFIGHDSEITAAAIAPDDRFLLTASEDGTMRLWDIATGAELARLIGLDGDDWLVLTPDGLFDGSEKGREKVMFRVSGSAAPQPVARYFDTLYQPGLLARLWHHEAPAAPRRQQVAKKGPPVVHIRPLTPVHDDIVENAEITVEVVVSDTGGGIREPRLKQNGSRVLGSPNEIKETGLEIKRTFTLQLVDQENRLEATAKSADGVESEPAVLVLRYEKKPPQPDLYLLAAGVSVYKDAALRQGVSFAAADARALAEVFQRRGEKGGLYAKVHSFVLLDDKATRKGIADALVDIGKKARPQDVFVMFLAGHGTEPEGRYFYLPYEAEQAGGLTPAKLKSQCVSIDELKSNLSHLQATKRLLILDTCHSGAGVARFSSVVVPPSAVLRGALEQLNNAQGIHALAAAPAKEQSKEHPELKHGLFTYAVLAALNAVEGGPLHGKGIRDCFVGVRELCNFACDQSPLLYQRYFDRPLNPMMQVSGGGMNFPLLPAADP